jgi:hypothetical protein
MIGKDKAPDAATLMIYQIGVRSQHDQPTAWPESPQAAFYEKSIKIFFSLSCLI